MEKQVSQSFKEALWSYTQTKSGETEEVITEARRSFIEIQWSQKRVIMELSGVKTKLVGVKVKP